MDCETSSCNGYELLHEALSLIPFSHYMLALFVIVFTFLYNFLEFHFLHDLFTGFRGDPVTLSCNSCSELYQLVASKCRVLHARYLPTPWLSSPHIQTAFLTFAGRAPPVNYRRQLFYTPDGGTMALDWVLHTDVLEACNIKDQTHEDKTPIAIIVPGLTSDSSYAYVKHIAFTIAKRGWNVVVSNHRGLGGISITSDCFYNGGWTEDVRRIISYIDSRFPEAPLFAIGTSIGANILVKYLAEEGVNIPLVGAAAVCSPWDLLICDRFINRSLVQRFYNRVITIGLQGYAQLHQAVLSRLADWDGITKSRSVRDFDNYATRVLGKYETVDTYYRRCSSVNFVGNVSVPLLCISALDDPVCTREVIPWDECRTNDNIILAVTKHGGHLAYHEGISASSLWWVRAVDEFLGALHSSPYLHKRKKVQMSPLPVPQESSIDRGPYLNIAEDGMVAALAAGEMMDVVEDTTEQDVPINDKEGNPAVDIYDCMKEQADKEYPLKLSKQSVINTVDLVTRRLDQLSRQNRKSIWLLAYIAIITSFPMLGSVLLSVKKKKWNNVVLASMLKR